MIPNVRCDKWLQECQAQVFIVVLRYCMRFSKHTEVMTILQYEKCVVGGYLVEPVLLNLCHNYSPNKFYIAFSKVN